MARKNGNHSKGGQRKKGKRKHYSPISNNDLADLHADFQMVAYALVTPLPENEDSPEVDAHRRTQLKHRAASIFQMVSTMKEVKKKSGLDLFGYVARASHLKVSNVKGFRKNDWTSQDARKIQKGVKALLAEPLVGRFNLTGIIIAFHHGHTPHPKSIATARDLRQ